MNRDNRPLFYKACRYLYRFATDSEHRSVALIRLKKPRHLFQPFIDTASDRYPKPFQFARDTLPDSPKIRILSFGCSTGEEVFTLRRYFPHARIKGIDINRRNIAICKARLRNAPDPGLSFEVRGTTAAEKAESYDAIFCMAVLRHGSLGNPGVDRCDHLLRFADFEATVDDLARCLKPSGILFIAHSNFRLCDTKSSKLFAVALSIDTPVPDARTPVFDHENRLIQDTPYDDVGFRKVRGRPG